MEAPAVSTNVQGGEASGAELSAEPTQRHKSSS